MNRNFCISSLSLILLVFSNFCIAQEHLVRLDGSSTVFRLSEAVSEEFLAMDSKIKVTVGISGTGGGFKKFCSKESDISNASRPIKQSEIEACAKNGVEFIELPVAYDALSIVVNKNNSWADSITVEELKTAWEPAAQEKITKWNQIRSSWPDKPIKLFGPGVDSGTYDYFTEAIMGKEDQSRGDYTSSEDDNVIVQGVSSDPNALGFFGLAYYQENADKLKALAVDDLKDEDTKGAILPSKETVLNGSYQPLARPLFVYVSKSAMEREEVAKYMKFYISKMSDLADEVGYIPLAPKLVEHVGARLSNKVSGTIFAEHGSQVGVNLEKLLSQ